MLTSTPQHLAGAFRSLIEGVCRALVAGNADNRCPEPVINLILTYLRRLAARFITLATSVPRPARPSKPRARPALVQRAARVLPTQWGWLAALLPNPDAHVAEMFALTELPELMALAKSVPQLQKLLRPLATMLGVGLHPELRPAATPRALIAAECRRDRHRFISLAMRRRLGMPLVDKHHRPFVRPTLKRYLRFKKRPERH